MLRRKLGQAVILQTQWWI